MDTDEYLRCKVDNDDTYDDDNGDDDKVMLILCHCRINETQSFV